MMKKLALMTFLFVGVFTTTSQAQQSINAGGGEGTGDGGSISYSIGQVNYMCFSESGITLTEGVQQFFEISKVLEDNFPAAKLDMVVYPNPATDLVNLKIENYDSNYLSYALFDMQGRQITTNKITEDQTEIQISNLPSAVYLLNVFDNTKTLKTFKIIKKN